MAEHVAVPIGFRGVAKRFGDQAVALHPLSLEVEAGEFLTLLGPSGSGKTTLLNIAAGYVVPDGGQVHIGRRDVTHLSARKRNIGMVFQNYALFPHLSVFENVAYGLRVRRVAAAALRRRVAEALEMVQLAGFGDRAIAQLSGGQQQRVALARAIVIEPDVLLMDEPLGALDRQLRKHVQLEIRRLQHRVRRTTLYVTHDQEEALVMSDRIGIMNAGRIEQIGSPRELYDHPANAFVASFLGESNLLHGRVEELAEGWARLRIPGIDRLVAGAAGPEVHRGGEAVALVRPESVRVRARSGEGVDGRTEEVVYLGELVAIRVTLPGGKEIWCRQLARDPWPGEGAVRVEWEERDVRILSTSAVTDR